MAGIGGILDQAFQEEGRLIREAQKTNDPTKLAQIQGTLQELAARRADVTRTNEAANMQKRAILGYSGGASPQGEPGSLRGTGPYDYRPLNRGSTSGQPRGVLSQAGKRPAPSQQGEPILQSQGDPFVESAKVNAIAADTNQVAKGIEGFDPSNEMHRLVVKSVLEDSIKSGKPVNPLDLHKQITQKLTDLNKSDNALLKTKSEKLTLKGKMAEISNKLQNKGIPGLDKKSISTLNGKINSISSQVDKFDNLSRLFQGPGGRSFLESLSQLKFKSLAALQRAGIPISESQRKSLQKFTIFRTGITNVFNTYRKEITGAAASDQELVRLEKAFIHMKMSPDEFEGAVRGLKAFGEMEMWRNLKMMEDRGQALDPNYKNKLLADDPELNSSVDQNYKRVLKDWQATTEWLNGRDDLDSLKGVERSTGYGEDQVVGSIPEAAADDTIIQTRVGPKTRAELEAELKRLEGSQESQGPTEGEALQAAAQGKAPGGISTPTELGQLASRTQAAPAPGDSPESLYQRTKANLEGKLPPSQVEEIARAAANRVKGR